LFAVNVSAVPPRSLFARFERPDAEPASIAYDVGVPDAAVHVSTTVPLALAEPERLPGGPGAAVHPVEPTTSTASFEGTLTPAPLEALTRTKYVPLGTPPVENVVAALPVAKLARFVAAEVDPASMTYDWTGSPVTGALQVSVTLLPEDVAVRLVGPPGATAPATAPVDLNSAAVKHAGAPDPAKQRPSSPDIAPAPKNPGVAGSTFSDVLAPGIDAGRTDVGCVGDDEDLAQDATKTLPTSTVASLFMRSSRLD
jgi:hypothetical protein